MTHHDTETELSSDELEEQRGEELPDREAMSILPIGDPTMTDPAVFADDEVYPVERPPHEPGEPPF